MMQNADNITSEFGFNPLQAPSQVGPMDVGGLGGLGGAGPGGTWSGTLRRPASRLDQLSAHISPRYIHLSLKIIYCRRIGQTETLYTHAT